MQLISVVQAGAVIKKKKKNSLLIQKPERSVLLQFNSLLGAASKHYDARSLDKRMFVKIYTFK